MLVPTNPRDHDVLWSALETALRASGDFHVVQAGVMRPDPGAPWTDAGVAHVVAALKATPLRFISARHGQPLAPHFALTLNGDGSSARLVELVTMRFRGDGDRPALRELLHDLGVVAVCVSMANPTCTSVRTPLRLGPDDGNALPEGFAIADDDGTIVVDPRAF